MNQSHVFEGKWQWFELPLGVAISVGFTLGPPDFISPVLRRLWMGRRDQRIFILLFNLIDLRQNWTRLKWT